ncbi:hypothetical protein DSO57_1020945 [Entomophthora muscae]|uniref:Uncharacterized protein n=1 Tax=Entomophthora muscae TaxID=34485 RepID=A0ACC2U245_9FUNG|nr:hypothetical protein DSO57_1020945 [Entomophthora muscae]
MDLLDDLAVGCVGQHFDMYTLDAGVWYTATPCPITHLGKKNLMANSPLTSPRGLLLPRTFQSTLRLLLPVWRTIPPQYGVLARGFSDYFQVSGCLKLTSKDLSPAQLAVIACKYLSPTNLKSVPNHSQLVKFVINRRQASNPLAKSTTIIKDLFLTDSLKKLRMINTATTWLCDGTFSTYSAIFNRLWVLYGQFSAQAIPTSLQDFLGCSKLPSYQQALPPTHTTRVNPSSPEKDGSAQAAEQLAHVRTLGTKIIIMDFELDQFRAFGATFNGEIQGCFFHFRQALIKHLKSKKGLFEKYLNDGPPGECYIKKHSTIFKGYLDYFEQQWVGKKVTVWRGKSGATAPWNCQSACVKGELKTNSSLEEEQARNLSKFCDLANRVAPKKRKSKEQDYQEDMQKVVKKKYKVVEIKKYLEDVATALAGGFN